MSTENTAQETAPALMTGSTPNGLRALWHKLQRYHSFRVYYRDGTRTRLLRWDDAVGCAETFKGTIKFDPR